MRRFRFPLQRLLRLRAHEERRTRRAYAVALAELGVLEQRAAVLARDLETCRDQAAGIGPAAALASALASGLGQRQRRIRAELSGAQARAEAARAEFRARLQEVRSLERLRDRQKEEWRTRVVSAEQGELEELARLRNAACPGQGSERP